MYRKFKANVCIVTMERCQVLVAVTTYADAQQVSFMFSTKTRTILHEILYAFMSFQ